MKPRLARPNWRECKDCENVYFPNLQKGGRLPNGYRICPHCKSENTDWKKEEED